ncbi:tryptophan synthase subunit alpha [Candidatus Sulcia muelleri]|uniref:tryptophan synthase subunit alpha n=1 Tax=Candidatus Karelsulcia muelleri TaxID=336810 RepID=UPI001FA3E1AC|nr:tryptophan synthase subunit alpha [Candidatus Karelsulcia muelleri]NHU72435.1 tryptophan synthase subunit alpha [Candidatus Karelsulcia muelleri]
MNKIKKIFFKKNILNIYITAGYPYLESMPLIIKKLQNLNIDIVEIGIPYSDPLADGKIIQESNTSSLKQGMNISVLFSQLKNLKIKIPIILMGYYNQFLKYGEKKFLENCIESGVSGLILPDLPPKIYIEKYRKLFKIYNIAFIFLITPQTSLKRILLLSRNSDYFLYIVSSNSTTGRKNNINFSFLESIKNLKLKVPKLIGFGIRDKKSLNIAYKYAEGAIIGSAFIKALKKSSLEESIENFLKKIL